MLTKHIFLAVCLVHVSRGFVVKKPKPKDVLAPEHQRNRYEDNDPTPPIRHHPDAYGRLASWIQQNARSYLPIRHPQTTLDVHVSAGLYQIVDLDQKNNLATVSAFFDVWWMDEFLVWRPADYDGITKIFVPMKWVWKPEFYMYHRSVSTSSLAEPSGDVLKCTALCSWALRGSGLINATIINHGRRHRLRP
ncbi:hypothetical protein Aduo_012702 [Ancylostoma duodenale]